MGTKIKISIEVPWKQVYGHSQMYGAASMKVTVASVGGLSASCEFEPHQGLALFP